MAIVVRPRNGRGWGGLLRRKGTGHFPLGPSFARGSSLFRSRIKGFFSPIDRRSRDNERASWLLLRGPQRSLSWRLVSIRFTIELVGLTLKCADFFRYS